MYISLAEALTFQLTEIHWPDMKQTLNSHRNMSLDPGELRLSFTSAIVDAVT